VTSAAEAEDQLLHPASPRLEVRIDPAAIARLRAQLRADRAYPLYVAPHAKLVLAPACR
jgi:hypothetical protein